MNFELSDEQRMWRDAVHDFASNEVKPFAREADESGVFNWAAARKMGSLGLLGLNIAEQFGGSGVDSLSAALAIEELGWACGSMALAIAAHNGLGCASVTLFGSEELQSKFLPQAASGKGKLAALALTEPGAGSDLKGGVRTKADKVGEEWVLNGSKMWCTNASIADFIVTLVRTGTDDSSRSLSLILVPTAVPGLHIGPAEKKMGLRGSPTHPVTYDDVRVPSDHLLGQPGDGLYQTLSILDSGRIGIGALSIGLAQSAFEDSVRYSQERSTFGRPISNYQAIQWMLADAKTEIEAARFLVYRAAWLKENGKPFTEEAAMAKLFATEMAERVCRNAIQIHGGYGYSAEFPVELTYRDARLMTIGEGTSEIQRLVIARSILS